MELTPLSELAPIIRSKNAGICWLTFDVMFDDVETYERVRDSGVVTRGAIANLYDRDVSQVKGPFFMDSAMALKVSIMRKLLAGDPDDTDVYGGQQHAPLLDLRIPAPAVAGG
jgi:hypothetical protein